MKDIIKEVQLKELELTIEKAQQQIKELQEREKDWRDAIIEKCAYLSYLFFEKTRIGNSKYITVSNYDDLDGRLDMTYPSFSKVLGIILKDGDNFGILIKNNTLIIADYCDSTYGDVNELLNREATK